MKWSSLGTEWIRLTASSLDMVGTFHGKHGNFSWLEMVVRQYEMFKNWPVTQSSRHAQFEEEANMATSSQCGFYFELFWNICLKTSIQPD